MTFFSFLHRSYKERRQLFGQQFFLFSLKKGGGESKSRLDGVAERLNRSVRRSECGQILILLILFIIRELQI